MNFKDTERSKTQVIFFRYLLKAYEKRKRRKLSFVNLTGVLHCSYDSVKSYTSGRIRFFDYYLVENIFPGIPYDGFRDRIELAKFLGLPRWSLLDDSGNIIEEHISDGIEEDEPPLETQLTKLANDFSERMKPIVDAAQKLCSQIKIPWL